MAKKISLFIVDDETQFLKLMKKSFPVEKYDVELFEKGKDVIRAVEHKEFDVGVIDIGLPDINGLELLKKLKQHNTLSEFIILTGQADVPTAIESMKTGCYDYLTKPISLDELEVIIHKAYEKKLINKENIFLKEELQLKDKYFEMVGKSDKIKQIFGLIEKVAKTPSLVLITGESGTGKELAARAIHKGSLRSDKSFLIVDCASIPENLLENELFGHEKGAYTDASTVKRGLFEVADGGTLFIDEIGEMPMSLQSKLLRIIETQNFRRLGSNKEIKVDVRIIAATNRDLKEEVSKGSFRKDLFYRLNVFPVHLPPLRERREDIPILVNHFIANSKVTTTTKKKVKKESIDILMKYDWPGNIRELANIIERAIIISSGETIMPQDLPLEFSSQPKTAFSPVDKKSMKKLVEDFEKNVLIETLNEFKQNKVDTAKSLGLSRAKLYRLLTKYKIT
ncbi:MAG: sigma-54-dependent Fis family transcriptional regulator [Endomicrobiales bacterium]|nr:sigma-54-dependent Fis family transcriptional regulator [Endomicrobiales bacterium]